MLQVQINFDWSSQNSSISMNPGLRPESIQNSSESKVCKLSMDTIQHLIVEYT